jgi:hypothetical protein
MSSVVQKQILNLIENKGWKECRGTILLVTALFINLLIYGCCFVLFDGV